MKRALVFTALIGVGVVSLTVTAQQAQQAQQGQAPAPKVVEAQKLRDNFYMLTGQGGGGNTAVFIGTDGVTLVDTKNPGWGQPIIDKVKELTPKPVTTIINTHTHGDHVSGNVEFPATVDVVVQENTASNMKKMAPVTGLAQPAGGPQPSIFERNNGRGLAKRTFKDKMTIGSGNDRIDLYYFGRGHTNGDAFVVFPSVRIMHAGDVFSGKNLPLLDANNGGSGVAIGDTLSKAAGVSNVESVITGHSTVMTVADVKEYAQFNKDFLAAVRAGIKAGKSPDDIAAGWKIDEAKYKKYTVAEARLKTNVQVIANELKK
jgi:cyclase